MAVDRCVCRSVPFSVLVEMRAKTGASLEKLSQLTGCCTECGTCRPYVELALATGEVDFPVLSPEEIERRLIEAARAAPGRVPSQAEQDPG